jgi:hypothetical protein
MNSTNCEPYFDQLIAEATYFSFVKAITLAILLFCLTVLLTGQHKSEYTNALRQCVIFSTGLLVAPYMMDLLLRLISAWL